MWILLAALATLFLYVAADYTCSARSDAAFCVTSWCECASEITTTPISITQRSSTSGPILLATDATGSCNFQTFPATGICNPPRSLYPGNICPSPQPQILASGFSGPCVAPPTISLQSHPLTTQLSSFATVHSAATTGSVDKPTVSGNPSQSSSASGVVPNVGKTVRIRESITQSVTLPPSTASTTVPTSTMEVTSAAPAPPPRLGSNPFGCSQIIPKNLNPNSPLTSMLCVCQGTSLPLLTPTATDEPSGCAYTTLPPSDVAASEIAAAYAAITAPSTTASQGCAISTLAPGNSSLAKCDDPVLTDPNIPSYPVKCEDADCQGVKKNALEQWQAYQDCGSYGNGSFLDRVAYSIGPSQGMYCTTEGSDTCESGDCTHNYNSPGGWLLAREIVGFTAYHRTISDYLFYTAFITDTAISTFSSTIAKVETTDTLWEKIGTAIAGLFGGQLLGVIVRKVLFGIAEKSAAANAEYVTQSKLFSSNIALSGTNIGVNLIVPATQEDITGPLEDLLGIFANQTREAIKAYVASIFSGSTNGQPGNSSEGVDGFDLQFGTGVWAAPDLLPDLNTLGLPAEISTIYFGSLTPAAWMLRGWHPVIFYDDVDCDPVSPWDDYSRPYSGLFNNAETSRVCYDGKTFWLGDWEGVWTYGPGQGYTYAAPYWSFAPKINSLSGIETLDGETWGTLKVDDLIISSWDGFKANNYQQPYTAAALFNAAGEAGGSRDTDFGSGIQTPGFINITICPITSLRQNDTSTNGLQPNFANWVKSPCESNGYSTPTSAYLGIGRRNEDGDHDEAKSVESVGAYPTLAPVLRERWDNESEGESENVG